MIRCVRIWTAEDGNSSFEEGQIDLSGGARGDILSATADVASISFAKPRPAGRSHGIRRPRDTALGDDGCDELCRRHVERRVVHLDRWRRDTHPRVELVRASLAGDLHLVALRHAERIRPRLCDRIERARLDRRAWLDHARDGDAGDLALVALLDLDLVPLASVRSTVDDGAAT